MWAIVLVAAGLFALVPFVAGPSCACRSTRSTRSRPARSSARWSRVLVLIALPMLLLGTVAPYAIRLARRRASRRPARVAGRLYAISTLGSLAGVVPERAAADPVARHAPHVPRVRARAGGRRGRSRCGAAGALAPPALAALLAIPVGTVKATGDGARGLGARDALPVRARGRGRPTASARLELNEGQAVHSRLPAGQLPDGRLLGRVPRAAARRAGARRRARSRSSATPPARPRARYGHYFPRTRVDAVEIDGELTDVGRALFDLRGAAPAPPHADARPFLRRTGAATTRSSSTPIASRTSRSTSRRASSSRSCRDRLTPGGVVLVNVGHPERSTRSSRCSAHDGDVFPHVLRDPTERRNTLLLASRRRRRRAALRRAPPALPAELRPVGRRGRRAPRAARCGRRRLHRRQGAGRVADRRLDRRGRGARRALIRVGRERVLRAG